MIRHALLLLCIFAVFVIPSWLVLAILLLAVLFYRHYFQALLPAVLVDVLHGARLLTEPLSSVTLWVALALVILSFVELYLRDSIRA
jgi:hypothetical protein